MANKRGRGRYTPPKAKPTGTGAGGSAGGIPDHGGASPLAPTPLNPATPTPAATPTPTPSPTQPVAPGSPPSATQPINPGTGGASPSPGSAGGAGQPATSQANLPADSQAISQDGTRGTGVSAQGLSQPGLNPNPAHAGMASVMDHAAAPDPANVPKSVNTQEIGASGLAQYGGFIRDEFLPQLSGDRGLKVYREMMDNDPVVGAFMFALDMLVRKVEWRVEPAEASSVEQIVAQRRAERAEAQAKVIQQQQQAMMQQQTEMLMAGQSAQMGAAGSAGKPGGGKPGLGMGMGGAGAGGKVVKPPPPTHAALPPANPALATSVAKSLVLTPPPGSILASSQITNTDPLAKASGGASGSGNAPTLATGAPTGMNPATQEDPGSDIGDNSDNGDMQAGWDDTDPDRARAEELAIFVETCMHDMGTQSWADLISQIITMVGFGFAYHETVYKKRAGANPDDPDRGSKFDDGRIGWAKIAPRAQETRHRWEFDENGRVLGMWQMAPPNFRIVYLPLEKSLLFRTSSHKDNPEGRALALDTPIPTPDGWRIMGDLQVGDPIFDETGRVRYVTAIATWEDRPTYTITFADGTTITADAEHQWATSKVYDRDDLRIRSTREIAATVQNSNGVTNHSTPWASAVQYPSQEFLIDPWFLGLWLGDGTSINGDITCHADDLDETVTMIEQAGYATKVVHNGQASGLGRLIRTYGARLPLRALDLKVNKHIPAAYLRGSIDQRLALLAGLMDSDGTVDKDGRCEFVNTNMDLVNGVAELVRSLGVGARSSLRKRANGTSHKLDSWCVKFTPTFTPFRLSRKIARCKPIRGREQHYFVSVVPAGNRTTKCIEVDSPSHMYLAGTSFIPTHNSCLRSAYRPWYFKRTIEEIEAIGIERDLAGLPVMYVPAKLMSPSATPEERAVLAAVKEIVRNIKRNEQEGVVLPNEFDPETKNPLWSLELLSTAGTRQLDIDATIARKNQEIAGVVLADFILLGHTAVGSRALADPKQEMFTTALEAWLQVVAQVFNTQAIPRLIAMNGEDPALAPTLTFGQVAKVPLAEIAEVLTSMAGAGAVVFPDDKLEEWVRKLLGAPPRMGGDEL